MNHELLQLEEQLMRNNRFRELIGIQIEDIREGYAKLSVSVDDKLLQSGDFVHGGVLAVLIDSVIASAIRTVLDQGKMAVTAEMNVNFLRPAKKGKLIAEGQLVNKGRLLMVGTGDVKDEEGRLLATGRATFAVQDR
ncbi:PaaI family thioesterase [Ammoniphilus sp. 3BR4]|uniref:PaaI family thioesterase n=1 Tax=Ammoniphilus sp. 3BR4 TaxID=3158265 RepID=UPI003465C5D3